MKERPILFSAPMVRAILEGRKTQTRRIVKPHRGWEKHSVCDPSGAADPWAVWFHYPEEGCPGCPYVGHLVECPYGKPGDRLWVRETWVCVHGIPHASGPHPDDFVRYRADDGEGEHAITAVKGWRPSIFMPRPYSRITLEITDVRVQRLQEISEEDSIAEGVEKRSQTYWRNYHGDIALACAKHSFYSLWESINGEGSWDANPWVWALTLQRVE